MKRKASIVFLALMVGVSSLSLMACNSSSSSSTTSTATNNLTVTGSDSAPSN